MERRKYFGKTAFGGAFLGSSAGINESAEALAANADDEIIIESEMTGKPHRGKVLAAIQAHLDDVPYKCSGTCAKLIREGYTAYLIRTSNDETAGGGTLGENILSNERENQKMAKAVGFTDVIDYAGGIKEWFQLGYPTQGPATYSFLHTKAGLMPEEDYPAIMVCSRQKKWIHRYQ